ncbi:MAG: hypothetical protein AAF629_15350 [Chloroflexota bacterium]
MTFNPQHLTEALNESGSFQADFAKDPQQILKQFGLTVPNEAAALMAQQLDTTEAQASHDILSVTRM